MKITSLTLPTLALGGAAFLLLSTDTVGFSTIGGSLGVAQRDFHILNNFTVATANNNTNEHPNWPGWVGADLSIWKGCAEWSSVAHGDGTGDPGQPVVGSGGANFDPIFVGAASGVGGTNDNTHSQISGCNGGVLAFAETPINNGWRIRYYECQPWKDGPGTQSGAMDIQGVACHEYGHALGLGHSNVNGATMFASTSTGIPARSIANDDMAGVQFIYGAMDPGKVIINSVAVNAGTITIVGSNFSANNNQIRFTDANAHPGSGGYTVTLNNQSSSGGVITASLPANAGPGEVQVRNQDLSGGMSMSNAFPYDPDVDGCLPASNYCASTANSNSGIGAEIGISGSQIVSDNNFALTVTEAAADKVGLFYFGPNQIQVAFGDGFRCVGGNTTRLFPLVTTDAFGSASLPVDLTNQPAITGGSDHNFQFWFRDPMGPGGSGFNLSDGINVPFCD